MYSDLTGTALFHGRHLDEIPELAPLFNGSDMPALGRQVLNQAPLVERLRELGYGIIANAQAWDEPALRSVDVHIEGSGFNEFERRMWWNSLPGSLWELRGPVVFQDGIEPWVRDAFAAFEEAASMDLDRPRFVFIHVPSPHFPIIFEADGSRADPVFGRDHPAQIAASDADIREAYAGQVEYLNRRVIETLDAAALPEDAIIAVISDHGPEFGLDWQDGSRTDRRTRFGAFLAVRNAPEPFPPNANVSSTLLTVLRGLGESDLPPMADRYFATDAVNKLATIQEVPDPYQGVPVEGD
jgi:arylsulfatase A-like enzyme